MALLALPLMGQLALPRDQQLTIVQTVILARGLFLSMLRVLLSVIVLLLSTTRMVVLSAMVAGLTIQRVFVSLVVAKPRSLQMAQPTALQMAQLTQLREQQLTQLREQQLTQLREQQLTQPLD